MAIQPIDLQTLFTQMDKVAKTQAALREGQQASETLQQLQAQKKLEENVQSVNQAQNMGDEAGKIKDENKRGAHPNQGGSKENQGSDDESNPEAEGRSLIKDPALGRNIDISG